MEGVLTKENNDVQIAYVAMMVWQTLLLPLYALKN